MSKTLAFLVSGFCFSFFFLKAADRAVLVHNSLQDIENCKDKLQLKLIRVWGGDEEEDENKFFETPVSVAVDSDQLVYICDFHNHCVKVFSNSGDYMRTIGRRGQGPGDMYAPNYITLSPNGDLLVSDLGNGRIQWFNNQGKSKHILKHKEIIDWLGVIPGNEIAVYCHSITFKQRKLITIMDDNGKILREIGQYHDNAKNFISSERLYFSIDKYGCIYASNISTPVIRKYSPGGRMLKVITFGTPFEIPVEITLNKTGDEIEREEETYKDDKIKVIRKEGGISIQHNENNKRPKYAVCSGIGIDSQNRIYIVSQRRKLTKKERSGTFIYGPFTEHIKRDRLDYTVVENIDVNRLMVFDENGKIIAHCTMTTFCHGIYIYNNRIFVVDGYYNQRVLEYEMVFKQ